MHYQMLACKQTKMLINTGRFWTGAQGLEREMPSACVRRAEWLGDGRGLPCTPSCPPSPMVAMALPTLYQLSPTETAVSQGLTKI